MSTVVLERAYSLALAVLGSETAAIPIVARASKTLSHLPEEHFLLETLELSIAELRANPDFSESLVRPPKQAPPPNTGEVPHEDWKALWNGLLGQATETERVADALTRLQERASALPISDEDIP